MASSNPYLAKYKERISLYEDPDNPLAPLTSAQRQLILDITHSDVKSRDISLPDIPDIATVRVEPNSNQAQGDITEIDPNQLKFDSKFDVSFVQSVTIIKFRIR